MCKQFTAATYSEKTMQSVINTNEINIENAVVAQICPYIKNDNDKNLLAINGAAFVSNILLT